MSIGSLDASSMDFFSLKGKAATVTGGNSGLGQVFAMAPARAGANVSVPGFTRDNGETKEMIEKQGVEMDSMQVDIAAEGVSREVITACCERLDTVDILVNNAGICKPNKVLDLGRVGWDPMVDVNLTAAFGLSYEAVKIMTLQKSGKTINICLLFSYLDGQWLPAYSTTRHALARFAKTYCDESGQYNIWVGDVSPGYYATDITPATRSNSETDQRVPDYIPANRWGDIQDLTSVAVLLTSPASNYVSGYLLMVSGGYLVCRSITVVSVFSHQ